MRNIAPSGIDLADLDTFTSGFPHDVFEYLRHAAPTWWHPSTQHTPDGEGFWVVSTHAETLQVFHDTRTFSSETGGSRPFGGTMIQDVPITGIMNMMDDPRHQRLRRIVNTGFTPRMIGRLEDELRRRARDILSAIPQEGRFDFAVDVAKELPLQAIVMLMGIPQEDRQQLCEWIDTVIEPDEDGKLDLPDDASTQAGKSLYRYGAKIIAEKQHCPVDDMLSVIGTATFPDESPDRLSREELLGFFTLLFAAGSETTRKAIAGGLLALIEHPDQMELLRHDRSLLPTAVDEIVRWTTPSVYKRRTATCDTCLGGQTIRAGEKVTVWEMSANRDEQAFEDPFRFDVTRSPNPHVAFGHGAHFCLGASLARLEIRVMFEELLDRFAQLELAGELAWTRSNRLFGLRRLPVRVFTDKSLGT